MSRLHPLALAAAALTAPALCASTALAQTPPTVNAPTPASLAQGKPLFTWTNGPDGERVDSIEVYHDPALVPGTSTSWGLFRKAALYVGGADIPADATSAQVTTPLGAGNYIWIVTWTDGLRDTALPKRFFRIAPRVSAFRIASVTKQRASSGGSVTIGNPGGPGARPTTISIAAKGRLVTNAPYSATCKVLNGRKVVARFSRAFITPTIPTISEGIPCFNLQVPSRLAGTRLTLSVDIRLGHNIHNGDRWSTVPLKIVRHAQKTFVVR